MKSVLLLLLILCLLPSLAYAAQRSCSALVSASVSLHTLRWLLTGWVVRMMLQLVYASVFWVICSEA